MDFGLGRLAIYRIGNGVDFSGIGIQCWLFVDWDLVLAFRGLGFGFSGYLVLAIQRCEAFSGMHNLFDKAEESFDFWSKF
jgi:hypothetical protein